jgi:predicted DNA-binding transcriptional regulator AlpA
MPIRGLNQNVAAEYIGVSPSKFDEMVQDGRMPPPKKIDRRRVWDIHQLDSAFDKLPCDVDEDRNSWDEILQMTTGRSNGPH